MDTNVTPSRKPVLPVLFKVVTWIDILTGLLPVLGFSWLIVSPFDVSPSKVFDLPTLAVISGISLWMHSATLKSVALDPLRYFSKIPKINERDKRFGEHVVVFTGIKLTVLTGLLVTSYQESLDVVFYVFLFVYLLNIFAYLYVLFVRKKVLTHRSEEVLHK